MPARLCALFQQLRVRLEVTHRVTDTLLDRDLRPPAECLELSSVKMHERRIAEPPALVPSRDISNTRQAELLDDDVCQIQHIHKLVVAKVEDVLRLFGVFNRVKNTINAVGHIKIRLALPSVSQDFKYLGIISEFLYKIEYHAMRITFSDPRHEAEDVTRDAKVFGVGLNHSLARELTCAVEAGLKRCVAFRRRKDIRFAINGGTTGKNNVLNLIHPHRLQDVPRGDGVLFKVNSRSLYAAAHISIRLKVEHIVAVYHFFLEALTVEDVGAHNSDLGVPGMVADGLLLAGAKIVIDSHVGGNLGKPVHDVAPDKAGAASYECPVYACQIHNSTKARVQQPARYNLEFGTSLSYKLVEMRGASHAIPTRADPELSPQSQTGERRVGIIHPKRE
jgi:hypothetical protein